MKLIVLYGAPAAGKLTIAQELAAISNIKVFDNHQVIDTFSSLVSRDYSDFTPTVYELVRTTLEAAVKADQSDVVMTFAFAANVQGDVDFLTSIITYAREHGSQAYPIFLQCDSETLIQRATEPSRKAYGKITAPDVMAQAIDNYDFDTPLNIEGNVTFNTKDMTAQSVAQEIKKLANLE